MPSLATPPEGELGPETIVFNGEGNRMWVYDAADPTQRQVLIRSQSDAAEADDGHIGLDLNAQICTHTFGPDNTRYFIAGEDTFQDPAPAGQPANPFEGKPGWGWFELQEDEIGEFKAIERGKLIPTWAQAGGQENYGCGFLPNGNLLLSDVGGQNPDEEATGQLHLWFLDEQNGFADETNAPLTAADWSASSITIDNESDGDSANDDANDYCMIDRSIGTAGGVAVDDEWAYIASNRPGPNGPGGIYRYNLEQLQGLDPDDCDDDVTTPNDRDTDLVDAGVIERQLWLPSDAFVMTPSALVQSGRTVGGQPTWYVSSVFTGVIAEYVDTGTTAVHLRDIVPPVALPIGQLDTPEGTTGGTPYGITVTDAPQGGWYVWWADLGITTGPNGIGPADGAGSFRRIHIADDDAGTVGTWEVLNEGMDYPDGTGVMKLR